MSTRQLNKVVNINLKGGLIGLMADSPQKTLNRVVEKNNKLGYRVVQVIPARSGNILLILLRILLLLMTVFLFTTANGYYLILEKSDKAGENSNSEKENDTETDSLFN